MRWTSVWKMLEAVHKEGLAAACLAAA